MAAEGIKILEGLQKKSNDEQLKETKKILGTVLASKNMDDLEKISSFIINSQFLAGTHKACLEMIAEKLKDYGNEEILKYVPKLLELMSSKTMANELCEFRIRKELAGAYNDQEEYLMAARTLSEMHIEHIKEKLGLENVVEAYVQITEYYLYAGNNADAYTNITRAANYIDEVKTPKTILKYKYCYAQVHDANLKFSQAASLYYELSLKAEYGVPDEELRTFLSMAVTCTILAPVGTQRSRLLTLLYKDERTKLVDNYDLLEKMYLERLILMGEIKKFQEGLKPHQKGVTVENYSVLEKAVLEHNVIAISRIYNNISYDQLAKLMDLPIDASESLISTMISEKKVKAHLNQFEQYVYFSSGKEMILKFNELIANLCEEINQVIESLNEKYPSLKKLKI